MCSKKKHSEYLLFEIYFYQKTTLFQLKCFIGYGINNNNTNIAFRIVNNVIDLCVTFYLSQIIKILNSSEILKYKSLLRHIKYNSSVYIINYPELNVIPL